MADTDLLKKFIEGNPPKNIRMAAARGLMPIPPHQMLQILVRLRRDPEPDVAAAAAGTLGAWPQKDVVAQLQSPGCSREVLEHFAVSGTSAIQEAIILNPETPGAVVASLASAADPALLETILYNRTRLLETPEILRRLKQNPAATAQVLAAVQEIESDFFGNKKQEYAVEEIEQQKPAEESLLELEEELPWDELSLEGLPTDPEQREAAILARVNTLTAPQKIKLALMGNREARAVLIRDPNKEVSRSVLMSPKLAAHEIESFASMRNVSEEVLRIIGSSKQWTRHYATIHNLVKNPKTPPMISQRLMFRLLPKDLMLLARDRGIPEAVRRNAERMVAQKNPHKA